MARGRLRATRAPGTLEPGAWLVLAVASGLNLSMSLLPMAAVGNLAHILGL